MLPDQENVPGKELPGKELPGKELPGKDLPGRDRTSKEEELRAHTESGDNEFLTTNQGTRINDNQHTLKAGHRGPSLLEDFIFREKITHFDHERIPERVVHARGSAAHGFFQVYSSMKAYTSAHFLQDPEAITPVYVRFSTVVGSRGSTDLPRDVRGFAVKFYTQEGNFDLVGNNMPVFFIQDAIKFPDLVHAIKPEPHNEIPQAASAHDTFWDFISAMPESMHMIMWLMSDRAIPRSYRMMEGFGVHTFRFVNDQGKAHFVKFHWKPLAGVHSVAWNEAQKISGMDPDFHRRDLYDAIEKGDYPEWELGVQLVPEHREFDFDFDLLDPTKIIPEEMVPVQRIGKLTLNRNPDNFFAETEQVAFHPGHIVPGIDFTNDPLLQGRLFSYTDTQLIRLGGPNFHEIPINRPLAPVHNNQRDGYMRQTINKGKTSYDPNNLGGGCPFQAKWREGGFVSYTEKVEGSKVRGRSELFFDHYSQAALFYKSQAPYEQRHLQEALCFELGKVNEVAVRRRMLTHLVHIDGELAEKVAEQLGLKVSEANDSPLNQSYPAGAEISEYQPEPVKKDYRVSPALSMANTLKNSIRSRKVAFLCTDGVDAESISGVWTALENGGAWPQIIAPRFGEIRAAGGETFKADGSFLTATSVLFDAVYVPHGTESITMLQSNPDAIQFVNEAYRHCKPVAVMGDATALLPSSLAWSPEEAETEEGVIVMASGMNYDDSLEAFLKAIAMHRVWDRELYRKIPS